MNLVDREFESHHCQAEASHRSIRFVLALLVCLAALPIACLPREQRHGPSMLGERLRPKPIEPGPDGLFLDIIFLERPFGDSELNHDLWALSDDEVLELRKRLQLEQSGFRVAVLGGQLPAILRTLFEEDELKEEKGQHLQMQSGSPTQVQTSGEYASWPVAAVAPEKPTELRNAVGVLRAVPRILDDGQTAISVTPEIQHGETRRSFVPDIEASRQMDWKIKYERQSRSFDELRFAPHLRSGQYLMLSCLTDDSESLAARFFSFTKEGRRIQRVILIRAEPSRQALAARGKL